MNRLIKNSPSQFEKGNIIVAGRSLGCGSSKKVAQIVGGLGISGSGVFGSKVPYFEPIHGSAPDIAGRRIANPIATIISTSMMLDYLGFEIESIKLMKDIENILKGGLNIKKIGIYYQWIVFQLSITKLENLLMLLLKYWKSAKNYIGHNIFLYDQ